MKIDSSGMSLQSQSERLDDRSFVSPCDLSDRVQGVPIAIFLDVDGTLLPIRPLPTDVRSDEALRALMRALVVRCDGAVAFVSGRMIADIDRIFAPLVLPAAGMHGAEVRFADGVRQVVAPDLVDETRPAIRALVAAHPGLMLEDKGLTLAVHFRQRPDLESDVVSALGALVVGRDISVQRGKMIAELRPANIDKGRAIARLMSTPPFAGCRPLFIGDDVTDESGFRYVNAANGVSVRVGPLADETVATFRLPDVDAVIATLTEIRSNVWRV